jgi:hypothetical protein
MVGLPRSSQASYSIRNLSGWLESYCLALKSRFAINFEIHFQGGLEDSQYSLHLPGLLEKTLLQASVAATPSSTIEVAAHRTRRGIEIEVIASCNDLGDDSLRAFSRERSLIGHGYSLATYRARCPDGSVAWIIVQTSAARLRQTA